MGANGTRAYPACRPLNGPVSLGSQKGRPSKMSIGVGVVALGVVTLPPVPFRKAAGSNGALGVRKPDHEEVDSVDDIAIE